MRCHTLALRHLDVDVQYPFNAIHNRVPGPALDYVWRAPYRLGPSLDPASGRSSASLGIPIEETKGLNLGGKLCASPLHGASLNVANLPPGRQDTCSPITGLDSTLLPCSANMAKALCQVMQDAFLSCYRCGMNRRLIISELMLLIGLSLWCYDVLHWRRRRASTSMSTRWKG